MICQRNVSLNQIATCVQEEELQCNAVENLPRDSTEIVVEIKYGEFSWDPTSNNLTLRGINLQLRKCMKVAVCGSVGSRKSSLLSSILGEIPKLSGIVKVSGTIAYVSYSPWIQSRKIEENILFVTNMNRNKYQNVLEVCALNKDLELFSHGDQKEIVSSRIISGNHVENCLQRSPFNDRYQNNYEEHFAEPYGEGCSKPISSEAEVPPFMEKVQFSVDDNSSKYCSLHQN